MKSQQKSDNNFFENSEKLLADPGFLLSEAGRILGEKDAIIDKKESALKEKQGIIESQNARIALLEAMINLAKARTFGRSSEKHAGQGELFDEAELCCDENVEENVDDSTDTTPPKPKKKGRKGLSENLPREPVYHTLPDEEKTGAVSTFFDKVKEELDIVPAKVRVLVHFQEKAVFEQETGRTLKAADLPKHPLGKTIASINLLAHIIISKYADGLPLYRQENILKRYGGSITRTSMANWVIKTAKQCQPLINLVREYQNSYDYIQMDETVIQVLKEPGHSPSSHKYMWVSRGGPPDQPSVLFDYRASRGAAVPEDLLHGFRGFLQADGYSSYDTVARAHDLTLLGCWDHARRKFVEAEKATGKPKNGKGPKKIPKYAVALSYIRKLYVIEARIKEDPDAKKHLERQRYSLPVLNEFKQWLDNNITKVATGGHTHKAMRYTLNQWPKLIRYCEDGRLNISNVLAENAIRPFVIGRKGWLFADTPQGAKASATHYSLIETAKANGLEPFEYYRHILSRLPECQAVEDYDALLPWNIKKSK